MTQQIQGQDRINTIDSISPKAHYLNACYQHIASTPEGCRISRDEEIGFVVACGVDTQVKRHVPTLQAAYAVCQQLMPRTSPDG